MKAIIHRHILKELFGLFSVTLVFFILIFAMLTLPELTKHIVSYGIGLYNIMCLIVFQMPYFLQFVVPMSVMIATLLTFLRMSADREIIALKASGVSLYYLLPPVLVFGLFGTLLTAYLAIIGLPMGKMAFKSLITEMVTAHMDAGLKPRQFINDFEGLMLYAHEINSKTKSMKHIFIEDRRSTKLTTTITARYGQLVWDYKNQALRFQLFDGSIHHVDVKRYKADPITFDKNSFYIDLGKHLKKIGIGPKDEEEMSLWELKEHIESVVEKNDQYYLTLMEWHQKFALPSACILLALIGLPLGVQMRISKRSKGIVLGLVFFFLYYIMLSAGWVFGEAGVYPPVIGMWLPNLVTLLIGLILLKRASEEKQLPKLDVDVILQWLKIKLRSFING